MHFQNIIPLLNKSHHKFGETASYHLEMGQLRELIHKQDRPFVMGSGSVDEIKEQHLGALSENSYHGWQLLSPNPKGEVTIIVTYGDYFLVGSPLLVFLIVFYTDR